MSLTLHQPNLPSSSHPCGQSWHHSSNVDISLLLKPRDDKETTSPILQTPERDERDRVSSPSQPSSTLRPRTGSTSRPRPLSTSTTVRTPGGSQLPPPPPPSTASSTRTTTSLVPAKRPASALHPPSTSSTISRHGGVQPSPAKKQSKWSPYEDAKIISLRAEGMKWEDISRHLPGRSAISCRLHYQNYLERRSEWDEDRKDRLARLYERFKQEMWSKIAEEMAIPWRAAEAMHWQIGEHDMAKRAGVTPFSLTTSSTSAASHNGAGTGGGGGHGSRSGHHHHHHSRMSISRSAGGSGEGSDSSSSYPRMGGQVLPSLSELTAGIPAFTHPIQPLLPGPGYGGYASSDTRTIPGTPYSSGLPYPGQSIIPSPGRDLNQRNSDYFLRRS